MLTYVGGVYRDSIDFIELTAIDIGRVATLGSFDLDIDSRQRTRGNQCLCNLQNRDHS